MATRITSQDNSWVLDSGASNHMTGNRGLLHDFRAVRVPWSIKFGNGDEGKVTGLGEVILKTSAGDEVTLRKVLYVPELTTSLLSVGKATFQAKVVFKADRCELAKDDRVVLTATSEANLYRVRATATRPGQALLSKADETAQLWHSRFGHLA